MKKAIALLLVFAFIGGAVFAQDATIEDRVAALEAKKAFTVAGSVEFGVAGNTDDPLWNLSSTSTATVTSTGTVTYDSDKVAASVGFNLKPTITKTAAATQYSSVGVSNYDALQTAVAFYEAATEVFTDLPALTLSDYSDYLDADDEWLDPDFETAADWNAVVTAYNNVTDDIIANIIALSPVALTTPSTSSSYLPYIDQFDNLMYYDGDAWVSETLTAAQLSDAEDFITAWSGYVTSVLGTSGTDSWAASYPVTSASFMFKKLFDVADLTLHMKGKGVGVGSMVTSINTAQDTSDETPLGMTLGLADGVVEGVSASMLFNSYAASAAVAEDFDTIGIEADAAVAHVFGLALSGGYTLPGEDLALSGNLTVGIKDLDDLANAYVVGLTVDFGMPSMFDLAVGFEFNYLAGNGMGAGVNVGAEIMGIAPSVTFLYKNAAFGGDDTYTTSYDIDYPVTDDVDTESGMQAEFDAIDSADAMALSIGLSVSTEKLMDLKLATLSGGYDMMLAGGTESGYNAALGFDFTDIAEVPVTLDASISNWAELGLNYGVSLGYTYEMVGITASYDVNEVDGETTYSVLAKISF